MPLLVVSRRIVGRVGDLLFGGGDVARDSGCTLCDKSEMSDERGVDGVAFSLLECDDIFVGVLFSARVR